MVAGLVLDDADRILIAQRPAGAAHPLEWEFPGGKIEPGEPPIAALVRELREELALEVRVGRIWDVLHHHYPDFELLMLVFACRTQPGATVDLLDAAAAKWLTVDQIGSHAILAADRPLIDRLVSEGTPNELAPARN